MARPPPPPPLLLLLLALLCGSAALSTAQPREGRCGKPIHIENAVPGASDDARMRYNCVKDYKRKAGTSSLVVCHLNKTTKTFQWNKNLICIRDPAKPEPEHVTEETKKETEMPTPASQPASPKPSTHPAAVSGDPYGSKTTSSTATTRLRTTKPLQEEPTTMPTPQETAGGLLGPSAENVTACTATKSEDSQPKSTKLPFGAFSTEISNVTAVPFRNAPGNTTWGSQADIRQGQTGVSHLSAILTPVAVLILLVVILGLWWFCRKHGRLRRQSDVALAEIPGVGRSGERGPMISAGTDAEGAGPADEEVPMRPSDRATSTG